MRLLHSLALLAVLIGVTACGGASSPAPPVVPPALVPDDCAGAHTVASDTADFWHVYLDTTRVLGDHFPFPGDTLTLRHLHAGRWLFIAYITDTGSERGATVAAYAVAPDSSWRRLASGVNEGRCVAFATRGLLDGLRPGEHVAFGITFVPWQKWPGEEEEAESPRGPPSYFLHVR